MCYRNDDSSIHIDTSCLTHDSMITIKHLLCFFALHLSFLFSSYENGRCVNVHVDVDPFFLASIQVHLRVHSHDLGRCVTRKMGGCVRGNPPRQETL